MKKYTNTGTWKIFEVCCINGASGVFIAAVASLLIEAD
jgi:hypothetical protein